MILVDVLILALLAGLVIHLLGHLPVVGDKIEINGMTFAVARLDDRRIDRLVVTLPVPVSGESGAR